MKRIVVLCLALWLTSCATFNNPLTISRLASLESAYGIALSGAVAYYELYKTNRCTKAHPFNPISNLCAARSIVVRLQQADIRAQSALQAARKFVINNPTIDATALLDAAQVAIGAFQQVQQQSAVQ